MSQWPRMRIRYKRNPAPNRRLGRWLGPKCTDDVSGAWTYDAYRVTDLAGNRVDPRQGTFDGPDNKTDYNA